MRHLRQAMHSEHSQSNSVILPSDSDSNVSMTSLQQSEFTNFSPADDNEDDRRVSSGVGTTSENASLSAFDFAGYGTEEMLREKESESRFRISDQSQMRHA